MNATKVTENSVFLEWFEPPKPTQHGNITHYTVYYQKSLGGPKLSQTVTSTSDAVINGLESSQEYVITVSASTSAGEGPQSTELRATTADCGTLQFELHRISAITQVFLGELF